MYTNEQFKAWLETQDSNVEYDYISNSDCAYAQFLKSQGEGKVRVLTSSYYLGEDFFTIPQESALAVIMTSMGQVPKYMYGDTFGQCLRRLNYLMDSEQLEKI